jgi:hypothetical protein
MGKNISVEEKVIDTYNLFQSPEFIQAAKKHPGAFSRTRKLTLAIMFAILINLVKCSSQKAIDHYIDNVENTKTKVRFSQQAFSKARQNLRWESCKMLADKTVDYIYEHEYNTWRNYRLLAIDGSKLQLPADDKLRQEFGTVGRNNTSPTAQVSNLYDILNGCIVDARIDPISTDERSMAIQNLTALCNMSSFSKELVLFDRGYPSFGLLKFCQSKNINFLMRLRSKFNSEIDEISLGINLFQLVQDNEQIPILVVKLELDTGEVETLITNLFDENLTVDDFKELYFKRWSIETQYGALKHKLEIENFSSRTKEGILQDFYISVYCYNIIAIAAMEVQPIIDEERKYKKNKYKYKMNFNHAVGVLKDRLVSALFEKDPIERSLKIKYMLYLLTKKVIPIRGGRSCPRNQSPRKSNFHHNQKSNC